jgi:hypothetical protein
MGNSKLINDTRVIDEINKKIRSCRALGVLDAMRVTVEVMARSWADYIEENGIGYTSSEYRFYKSLRTVTARIEKRIKLISADNARRARLQQMKLRNASELQALIMDGSLSTMRMELAALRSSLVNAREQKKEPTETDKVEGQARFDKIFKDAEVERNELKEQGNEMAKLFGVRAIDTGKAELDTDIDTFMKEV